MRRQGRLGQSLLESAFATVVLLTLMVAIVDFSQVLYLHQTLAEHVRDTARWAAVRPVDPDAIRRRLLMGPDGDAPYLGLSPSNLVVEVLDSASEAPRLRLAIVGYRFRFLTPGLNQLVRQADVASETIPLETQP